MAISWLPSHSELKAQLQTQQAQYRRLIDNIPEVVWRGNEQGDALFISERIVSLFGYTSQEVLDRGSRLWFGRMHPADRERVTGEYAAMFSTGRPFDVEYRIQHRDGHWMWWHDRAVLAEDASQSDRLADGLVSDITEVKRLQEQLEQSHKLEAVGQLAGGIAHDFNNLIQVISGYVALLGKSVDKNSKAHEYSAKISAAAERAGNLTQQLLAFSRKQLQQVRALDLNHTVTHFCGMLSRVLGENIELVFRLTPQTALIKADPTQIEQVLMNLAVNARDAMPTGGKLIIETNRIVADDAYARQHGALTPGEYILMVVTDTGIGIDAITISRIFEPFFTTKEKGKGTGLGLATVYGIVKQNGGHISVYSEKGKGSSFRIYLPLCEDCPKTESIAAAPEPAGGTETVLLVEDEIAVRDLARVLLEDLGYRVLCAEDAQSALKIVAQSEEKIDLLLTDVVMPGLSGRELAEKVQSHLPQTKVVYMTGYTDDALFHHRLVESNVSLLRKPFTREQLAFAVRAVLDGTDHLLPESRVVAFIEN